jgi:hypothetical protein
MATPHEAIPETGPGPRRSACVTAVHVSALRIDMARRFPCVEARPTSRSGRGWLRLSAPPHRTGNRLARGLLPARYCYPAERVDAPVNAAMPQADLATTARAERTSYRFVARSNSSRFSGCLSEGRGQAGLGLRNVDQRSNYSYSLSRPPPPDVAGGRPPYDGGPQ